MAVFDRIEGRVPEQAKDQIKPTVANVEPKKDVSQDVKQQQESKTEPAATATEKKPERVDQKQAAPEQAKSQPAAVCVE